MGGNNKHTVNNGSKESGNCYWEVQKGVVEVTQITKSDNH